MSKPTIEISVQMFEFQKRFWWMLSSIDQQKEYLGNIIPDIKITVSTMSSIDRFKDLTYKMINTFKHLSITIKDYKKASVFGNRGLTRNLDIKETKADWLFFTDADMIFHPHFFSDMSANYLDQWKGTGKLITAARINIPVDVSYKLIDSLDYNSKPVSDVFNKCWDVKMGYSCHGRAPGAGYFQLIEADYLKKNNINYCNKIHDRTLFSPRGNKFKSDRVFRGKLNGTIVMKKPKDELGSRDILKPLLHLNHWRKSNPEWIDKGQ